VRAVRQGCFLRKALRDGIISERFQQAARGLAELRNGYVVSGLRNRPSIENTIDFLAKAAENTRFGDAHRVRGDAQIGGDLGGAFAFQHEAAEGTPRGRLELRLDQDQQPPRDVAIMFFVSKTAEMAVGIFQLIEDVPEIAAAGSNGARTPATPEDAQSIDCDVAKPTTEGTRPQIVPEIRQLADEHLHHFLRQIIAVGAGEIMAAQPIADEGSVQIHQPLP